MILSNSDSLPKSTIIKTFLFVALAAEAKPLIAHFKLKKNLCITAFSIYANEELALTVTGIGKMAMAAGVAYTQAVYQKSNFPVFINIGVAGHRHFEVGRVLRVDKITDYDSGKNFFPPLITSNITQSSSVTTVSKVHEDYLEGTLHDMEASGFYSIALKFTTAELAQSLKIVSDNKEHSTEKINAARVGEWMAKGIPELTTMVSELNKLAALVSDNSLAQLSNDLFVRWHFTAQQRLQLEKLLKRWYSLSGSQLKTMGYLKFKNAVDVISWLDKQTKILLKAKR